MRMRRPVNLKGRLEQADNGGHGRHHARARIVLRGDADACAVIAQTSLRSKRLRGVDPRDAAERQQRAHARCDQRDRGAYHERSGTEDRD